MAKPHSPIEHDIATFILRYAEGQRDEGDLLVAVGKAFPGCSYGVVGRALILAGERAAKAVSHGG